MSFLLEQAGGQSITGKQRVIYLRLHSHPNFIRAQRKIGREKRKMRDMMSYAIDKDDNDRKKKC